jgi:hypothetical protein
LHQLNGINPTPKLTEKGNGEKPVKVIVYQKELK